MAQNQKFYKSRHTGKEIDDAIDSIGQIDKEIPTDINVDSDGYLILEHDGQEITEQKKQVITPKYSFITYDNKNIGFKVNDTRIDYQYSNNEYNDNLTISFTEDGLNITAKDTMGGTKIYGKTIDFSNAFGNGEFYGQGYDFYFGSRENPGTKAALTLSKGNCNILTDENIDDYIRANDIITDKNIITNGGFIAFTEATDLAKILYNEGRLRYEITGYGAGSYPFTVYLQTDYDWNKYDDAYILTNRNIKTICGNDLYSTTGGDVPLTSIIPASTTLDINQLNIGGVTALYSYNGFTQATFSTLIVGMEGRIFNVTSTGDVYIFPESGSAPSLRYSNSTGNLTLTGDISAKNLTATGDVTIQGNLSVSGTTTTVDTETVKVKDNIIVTNSDKKDLIDLSGLAINTNASDTFGIMYNPASNTVNLGLGKIDDTGKFTYNENEGSPLAIRDINSSFTQDHLISWDDNKNKLVDSGIDKYNVAQTNKENSFEKLQTFTDIQVNGYLDINYPDVDIIRISENADGNLQFDCSRVGGGITVLPRGSTNTTSKIITTENIADNVANKLDKFTEKSETSRIYLVSKDGAQAMGNVDFTAKAYYIPRYSAQATLTTQTPQKDIDCTNKQYVDNAIASVTIEVIDLSKGN